MAILLELSVTAPLRAKALPQLMLAPVISVMLVSATMSPTNIVSAPSVAELPTRQNTLVPSPPPITLTLELLPVVRALPMLNTNTAFGFPKAFRVRAPVSCAVELKL